MRDPGSLTDASRELEAMIDGAADWSAELLRRTAAELRDADDDDVRARRAVEGGTRWRAGQGRLG